MDSSNPQSRAGSREASVSGRPPTSTATADPQHLTDLLLDSLPHPALLIRRDQVIVTANRAAASMGAKIGDLCWRSFCRGEFIPEDDKRYLGKHAGSLPPGGTQCTFCRRNNAFAARKPVMVPAIAAFDKLWDIHWVPLENDLFLHYAIDITVHEQAKRELTSSRARLDGILRAAPVGIGRVKNRRFKWVSAGFVEMLGYSAAELVGKSSRVVYPNDAEFERVGHVLYRQIRAEGTGEIETRLVRKDGTLIHVLVRSAAMDKSGRNKDVIFTALDITAHKQTQAALHRKNAYLRALHEITIGILQRRDLQQLLQAIVRQAVELTAVPNGFLMLYKPQADVLELKAGHGIYTPLLGRQVKPGEGLAGRVWQSGKAAIIDHYHSWSGRVPDTALDVVQCLLAAPLKLEERIVGVLGLSHHECGRQFDAEMIKNIEPFAELAVVAIDNARLVSRLTAELRHRRQMEDERRRMEDQLRQAQKMEAIGTLAGGIAHDFNNILSAIIGFTELAADDAPPGSRQQQNLLQVLAAGSRATDLVRQILTFSRRGEQEFKPIDLAPIVKESLKLLRASLPAGIAINHHIGSNLSYVLADPVQIHQIMMNLGTNAAHAMEDQETGTFEVTLEEIKLNGDTAARFVDLTPGHFLKLTVADSGCGMPAEVIPNIFDPYFTTKPKDKGTGLGLAMVHGIVKTCGGGVMVSSRPGEGAVFEIYLPAVALPKKPHTPSPLELPRGSESILFVDDEPALATIGAHRLERLGYRVTVYSKPLEALERVRADPRQFDLVITDLDMPCMSGTHLAAAITEIRPDLAVILCTGFSERMSAEKAQQMGIAALLIKPVNRRELAVTVRRVLDRKQTSSAG